MSVRSLIKLELINFLGINELRYVKDKAARKQKGFLFGVLIVLYGFLAGYIVMQSMLLDKIGATKYIPVLYFLLAGMINMLVGIYRAKDIIYREKDQEMVSAYPLSGKSIVASRVFRMYFDNLIVGLAVIIPSMLIYGIRTGCGILFYISIIPVCIISPILPTAVAAWVGIIFAAILARNRHKVLTEVILVITVVTASFMVSGIISSKAGVGTAEGFTPRNELNEEINAEFSRLISEKMTAMENAFPAVKILGDMLTNADFAAVAIYALISLVIIIITVTVIGKYFFAISRRLFLKQEHKCYNLSELKKASVLKALVKKEASRYFSSGVYVSNTIVGPVIAVILAVSLGFVDINRILLSAGNLPIELKLENAIPYLIGLVFSMISITSSSISIEGKSWWIMKTMPLKSRDIYGAKILFNLIFVAPFYALTEIILLFTVNAGPLERLWLIVVPALTTLYSVLLGLFCNLKFPKFNWENETEVIKQGAATGLSMLGALPVMLFIGGAAVMTDARVHLLGVGFIAVLSIVCWGLYRKILAPGRSV
ncbi:MAG TPA: hypothetical protein DEO83_04350 [Lachnospiraceae bacterium]|nr:hypothetical protein [Lachnospiraceae bacterium]